MVRWVLITRVLCAEKVFAVNIQSNAKMSVADYKYYKIEI